MARREFKGNAAKTRLSTGIGSGDTSFSINSNSGWPTGGANGAFSVILDPDVAGVEEHVLVANQSGGSCTGVTRGVGDTSAVAHAVGADGSVIHGTTRLDYDEANRHINVTTDDNHTQYMKTDGTRHDLTARHTYGAAMGTRPVPIAVGTSLLAGSSAQFAAGDHQHVIGTAAINLSNMFAAGVVDAAAIGTDQVGTLEIAPLAVTSAELAAAAVIAGKVAAGGISASNQLADAIVTLAKFASEAGTDYDPNFDLHGVTLGVAGVQWGRYFKLGRLVVVFAGFGLGTSGGNVTGEIGYELPAVPADITPAHATIAHTGFITAALASDASPSARWSGLGLIVNGSPDLSRSFATAGSSAIWDANTPFDWTNGDNLASISVYEAVA